MTGDPEHVLWSITRHGDDVTPIYECQVTTGDFGGSISYTCRLQQFAIEWVIVKMYSEHRIHVHKTDIIPRIVIKKDWRHVGHYSYFRALSLLRFDAC